MKTAHRDWRLAVKREGTLGCTHNDREGCLWMGFDPQLGDSVYLGIEQGRAGQSRAEQSCNRHSTLSLGEFTCLGGCLTWR